jgi:hypothetical protein
MKRVSLRVALVLALAVTGLVASAAVAAAAPPEKVEAFVCPILGGKAGENGNSPKIIQLPGGDYTIIGPNLMVPRHATNQNGAGSPGGAHASPGDHGYSPIWNLSGP